MSVKWYNCVWKVCCGTLRLVQSSKDDEGQALDKLPTGEAPVTSPLVCHDMK